MYDLFVNPARLGALISDFIPRIKAAAAPDAAAPQAAAGKAPGFSAGDYETDTGVALIAVRGGLVSAQIPGWQNYAATTYEGLVATIEKAVADPSVQKILLSVNSPGGTVLGCAEAAARIDLLSEKKPIWSCCSMADSAAYWLAAATNKIIVDPTGEVGSIGVIMTHFDISKLLESFGVKATHLFSGDSKADGSPYMPLGDAAQARIQSDLDELRAVFVDSVAAFRGMSFDAVHGTQAMTYKGQSAIDTGLADASGFYTDVLNQMAGRSGSSIILKTAKSKESPMAKTASGKKPAETSTQAGAPAAGNDEDCTCEEENAAAAAAAAPLVIVAAVDERARCAAIIGHAEAAGRSELAHELAFGTDLSPEAAGKLLAKAPKAAAAPKNALAEAMDRHGSPKVGVEGQAAQAGATENPLLASVQQLMPGRFKKA